MKIFYTPVNKDSLNLIIEGNCKVNPIGSI